MLSNCKYAIFDNDGTILNSMYYWRLGVLEYLLKYEYPVPEMSVRELLTQSSRRFAMTFAEREGLDMDEVGKELDSYMDRHYQFDVRPKRGIEDVFRTLKQNGAKLCVATAAPREICYRAMEKFGFLQYFEFVTGGDKISVPKREAGFFEEVCEMLGARPEECWVFEDSLYALKGAKKAGCFLVGVEDVTAERTREEIREISDIYVTDYAQLVHTP